VVYPPGTFPQDPERKIYKRKDTPTRPKDNVIQLKKPEPCIDDPIIDILRTGARKLLAEGIEDEIEGFLSQDRNRKDDLNHQRVVRNGYLPEREIQTGIGPIPVKVPRTRDSQTDQDSEPIRFTSSLLPRYLRKTKSMEECLQKDHEALLTFYDFPAEHWRHIRTTNPIESTFSTVRLRTDKARGCFSVKTVVTMAFKLCQGAPKRRQRLHCHKKLDEVIRGVKFIDGIEQIRKAA
jgi:transposase-like protein